MARRLIIVGRCGTGKSSTCNTLIGKQLFKANNCAHAVSTCCQLETNKDFIIVDTPGLFDSERSLRETALEIQRSVEMCRKPHAFLLVFTMRRITREDEITVEMIEIIFGSDVFDYSIVLLTHRCECDNRIYDQTSDSNDLSLEGSNEEYHECKQTSYEDNELMEFCTTTRVLSDLVERCKRRVVGIENVKKQCNIHTRDNLIKNLGMAVNSISDNMEQKTYSYRFINIHRQTLLEHTTYKDDLLEEIRNLKITLAENLEKAGTEEKKGQIEREEKKEKKTRRTRIIKTIGSGIIGCGGTVAVAAAFLKATSVGFLVGGPIGGILVGVARGIVIWKKTKPKDKQE